MVHEHGHLIDDLAPNEGALGEQYNYYTDKIYSKRRNDGYRVALTEQSSYAIGNATGRIAETEKILDDIAEGILDVAAGGGVTGGEVIKLKKRLENNQNQETHNDTSIE